MTTPCFTFGTDAREARSRAQERRAAASGVDPCGKAGDAVARRRGRRAQSDDRTARRSLARAEQAFRSVRARFAGTPEASLGALLLGRIAYDQRGNLRDAERWFRDY